MWERRGAGGGGGVIYAERAPLPSPLTVPARCSEPEGAQLAGERASAGSRVQQRGLPATACALAGRLHGAPCFERSKRQSKSPGAEPGEPAAEAPVPLRLLPCKPGRDRSPPRRPRALHSVPRCPRDGLRARKGLAALLRSRALRLLLTAPGCAPGRPRPEKLVVRAA